ncbi:MAG: TRAP transporter large permease [Treponemataceae bacterium]
MLTVLFISFLILLFLGMPIGFSMGLSALLAILSSGKDILMIVPAKLFSGLDSFTLMAIPLFLLAGKLMEEGGVSERLVKFANALVGSLRGGLSYVAVVSSVIFAGISGSASADTSAIGSILIPSMINKGYKKGWVACLIASGGTIGPVIPPSLLMIIYSSITGLSIATLFLAGIIPGLLMAGALLVICYFYARKHPETVSDEKFSFKALWISFKDSFLALMLPVVIVGGILSGVFTATEAAAVSVMLALAIGLFIYREISLKDMWRILAEAAKSSAMLMIIIGMASIFAWVLGIQQFPKLAVNFLTSLTSNPSLIILLVIVFLLIIGCFVETIAALVILIPVLHPIALQFGFNPIHFAMVVVITALIGAITPPVGILLFISAGMAKIDMKEVLKYVAPFIICLTIVVFIVAYVPWFTMVLPNLLLK